MMKNNSLPIVGGISARHLYEIIERSPICEFDDGTMLIDLRLCDEHAAQWQSAYQLAERDLMAEMEVCCNRHQHGDMPAHAWRWLVVHAMADRARELLGIRDLHPFWC
jgi:hypothetical protein